MTAVRTVSVTLIRHAKTIYPQGTLPPHDPDIDLSDDAKINAIAGLIPHQADWWISPLSRCQKTAKALKKAGATPHTETTHPQIFEQKFGDWHGVAIDDIWKKINHLEKTNWFFLHPDITPPNGESFNDVITRLKPVMAEITNHQGDHLVLICHGLVIRAFLGLMMRLDAAQSLAFKIDPLSATRLSYMAEGRQGHGHQEHGHNDVQDGGAWYLDYLNR